MYFCQTYDQQSLDQFRKIAEDFLYENEAEYNLIIGLLESKMEKSLITVHAENKLIGCAIQTSPYNLVLTKMPHDSLQYLSDTVKKINLTLPGVVGPKDISEAFAKIWGKENLCQFKMAMDQKIYKLTKVIMPLQNEGVIRTPSINDYQTLLNYFTDFTYEALPEEPHTSERIKINLDRRLADNQILVLEVNKEIVGLVSSARPTKHGQCIAPVYTPKKFRGKGYASTLVATMSQNILDSGKQFCCLYTDLNNPTSNSIYQKVGYEEIATSRHFVFY